jgi:EAL domain-containing protein (putative c-di-GMP-specific phosphodiesterase class I)
VLGRLTGTEFGIALPNANRAAATGVAERVAARLADLHRRELTPTHDVGQIGVTLYEGHAKPAALLAEADEALRTAQAAGPNRWAVYEPAGMPGAGQALSRQEWVRYLAHAVERRDLVLYAQPVVSGQREDSVLHREILFRIKGPDGILCTAGQVMPMVEELGLTGSIDRLVVEQVMAWLARQAAPTCCAVNLSPDTLCSDIELDWLYQALSALPGTSGRLVFEFSELGVVHELERLKRFSERVRALGHGFALDHFGRAFSNFGYLRSLRPDYVKIDGGFTSAIGQSRDDQFFVKTLAGIAHSLDVAIIAQMVETDEQYDVLRGLQIDGVQGYIVGRPEPLEPNA